MAGFSSIAVNSGGNLRAIHQPISPLTTVSEKNASSHADSGPPALEESALVDGCTRWQVIWKVVFPMARAGLFATAIFTFVFAWNEFLFALVLTRTEVVTYTVQVTHYFGGQSNFWAKISAMSVLGTLPIFIVVAFMQRYLVRGISLGAVKG